MRRAFVLLLLTSAALAGCLAEDAANPTNPPSGAGAGNEVATFYIDTGFSGSEPNMGITSEGNLYVTAFSQVLKSTDRGETYEVVHVHELPNSDPMLWVDAITDTVYHAPMFPTLVCAVVYQSTDEGASFSEIPSPVCGKGAFDHQKLASGIPGPDLNPLAGVPHETVLYMCYNTVPTTNCAVSYDGGQTWPIDRPVFTNVVETTIGTDLLPTNSGCFSGQNGHPTVSTAGVVAMAKSAPSCDSGPHVAISRDSGLTWTIHEGPDDSSVSLDSEIAFTEDETMYLFYQDADHHKKLAKSSDYGATWDYTLDVNAPGVGSTIFEALHAGSPGRIAFAYLGSENFDGNPSEAPLETIWHLYIAYSDDADTENPTFQSIRVTPDDDPVQRGCALIGGGSNPCRNMLDFIDGSVAPDGTFYVTYTEGCTGACNTVGVEELEGTEGFRDQKTAVARLDGFSLISD